MSFTYYDRPGLKDSPDRDLLFPLLIKSFSFPSHALGVLSCMVECRKLLPALAHRDDEDACGRNTPNIMPFTMKAEALAAILKTMTDGPTTKVTA